MGDKERPILVFGATGRQGGSVARALLRAGWPVRALVRDTAAPATVALRDAGAALVQGSFADSGAMRAAMAGAHGVFSVLPSTLAEGEEVRAGIAIADLAAEAGVSHLVYSSGASVGNTLTGIARFDAKPLIEAHVRGLPVVATIMRPMIFMDMLVAPRFGLADGRFTFLLRPDQAMQLAAVEDIGAFVAAVFADAARFGGATLKLASDVVTGQALAALFTEAAGRPITYARIADAVLAANPDLRHMADSLEDGPLAEHADLRLMREINPGLVSFRRWLAGAGRAPLAQALGAGGGRRPAG